MSNSYAVPAPLRTFTDPATGVTMHQVTDCPEGAKHLYFTRRCWTGDGQYFLFLQVKEEAANYWVAGLNGEKRQITHFPPKRYASRFVQHMHRIFYSWEADLMTLIGPGIHPRLPLLVIPRENALQLIRLDNGDTEVFYTFPEGESEMPRTGVQVMFTADGRDLLLASNRHVRPGETRIDPPDMAWDFSLRDESIIVGKLWRYDFDARLMRGCIFQSNGEQSHVLACPWDAERLLWVNYLHKRFYTMNRDGSGLRSFLGDTAYHMGHYNWDTANRRLTTLLSEPKNNWWTHVGSLDIDSGDMRIYQSGQARYQWHQNASPDGRWIVMDGGGEVGDGRSGLILIDQRKDAMYPLCQATWGLPITDEQGRKVKSEFRQHPNPSWSPDGRYVVFSSDYGTGIPQVYLADTTTLREGQRR